MILQPVQKTFKVTLVASLIRHQKPVPASARAAPGSIRFPLLTVTPANKYGLGVPCAGAAIRGARTSNSRMPVVLV